MQLLFKIRYIAIVALAITPLTGSAETFEEFYQPPPPKSYSWKANAFVASAFLAVIAGIVVICLDGGTSNGATQRLNYKEHHHHRDHHHRNNHLIVPNLELNE